MKLWQVFFYCMAAIFIPIGWIVLKFSDHFLVAILGALLFGLGVLLARYAYKNQQN